MKKYRNLLFDLDHTLWDFERNSKTTLVELFQEYNLDIFFQSIDEFLNSYHRINSMLWSQYGRGKISKHNVKYERFSKCLGKAGSTDKELSIILADEYVKRSPCKTFLIDGALQVIETLASSYKLHIITNGFNEVQFKKIKFSGLGPFFENIFTSEDAGFQKPDTGFFQYIINSPEIRVANSIVIGDNLITDIAGAKDFGIDTVFFNPGGEKDYIGSTFMISKLSELLPIF